MTSRDKLLRLNCNITLKNFLCLPQHQLGQTGTEQVQLVLASPHNQIIFITSCTVLVCAVCACLKPQP